MGGGKKCPNCWNRRVPGVCPTCGNDYDKAAAFFGLLVGPSEKEQRAPMAGGIVIPAIGACPEATADTRRPVRFPDTMAQPPAFLLKPKRRYEVLMARIAVLAFNDYRPSRYWAQHYARLRRLLALRA